MHEKLGPWIPAIFCAFLSLITVLGNLILDFVNGTSRSGLDLGFYCFLPMCFFLSECSCRSCANRIRISDYGLTN